MLKLQDKQAIVAEVSEVARQALSAVGAHNLGLTVSEMTELRKKARSEGIYLKVVRNTLARRAVADTSFACLSEKLVGPVILAFGQSDPGAPARLLKEFAKAHEKIQICMFSVGGQAYEPSEIDRLASLPTRDEALAQLLSVMQAPITKLVRTLVEPHTKLVRTFAAIADQKRGEA